MINFLHYCKLVFRHLLKNLALTQFFLVYLFYYTFCIEYLMSCEVDFTEGIFAKFFLYFEYLVNITKFFDIFNAILFLRLHHLLRNNFLWLMHRRWKLISRRIYWILFISWSSWTHGSVSHSLFIFKFIISILLLPFIYIY
jgi:hypothetical protein